MKIISVIGGGWLGKPLAHHLMSQGGSVYVSKTTNGGVQQLCLEGLDSFKCDLSSHKDINNHLSKRGSDVVIGCFPPRYASGEGKRYVEQWENLVNSSKEHGVSRIVMVSSTAVYPNSARDMTEKDATLEIAQNSEEFTDKAKLLLQAESVVINSGLDYAIVRCSGLTGPNRSPYKIARRLKQASQDAPVNMIHLDDVMSVVSFMSFYRASGVFNATTPETINKALFYQAALDKFGLNESLPLITHVKDKRIVANKLLALGYDFKFKHVLDLIK